MLGGELVHRDKIRGLSRREYDQLVELGYLVGEPIELLRGQLVEMSPQGGDHADVTAWLTQRLILALGESFDVRAHSPYAATDDSEPEPDISVSRVRRRGGHPNQALLLVEVAASSQRKDRVLKAGIYADNGAPEYWVIDIRAKTVHVHTRPADGGYASVVELTAKDTLRPTKLPAIAFAVRDVLRAWNRR